MEDQQQTEDQQIQVQEPEDHQPKPIQQYVQEWLEKHKEIIVTVSLENPESIRPWIMDQVSDWLINPAFNHDTLCQLYVCTLQTMETIIKLPSCLSSKEIWKNGAEIGYSRYDISNQGRVRNVMSKRYLSHGKNGNYRTFHLVRDNKKQSTEMAHRLVALLFIPNPDNKPTVDHINRIENDNRCYNLRWATRSEQSYNRKKPQPKGRPIYQCDLHGDVVKKWNSATEASSELNVPGRSLMDACSKGGIYRGYRWFYDYLFEVDEDEEWRPSYLEEYEDFEISSKGRIRRPNGKIVAGTTASTYREVNIYNLIYQKYVHFKVQVLVANVFLGKHEDLEVNHKNGNKHDNRVENLEFVTHSENLTHAYQTGLIGKMNGLATIVPSTARAVRQIDPNSDKIIAEYESIRDASTHMKINEHSILNVCQGCRKLAAGYKWKYVHEDDNNVEEIKKKIIGRAKKPVRQINKDTGETIAEYPCAKIAALDLGIRHIGIGHACRGYTKTYAGFIWNYV